MQLVCDVEVSWATLHHSHSLDATLSSHTQVVPVVLATALTHQITACLLFHKEFLSTIPTEGKGGRGQHPPLNHSIPLHTITSSSYLTCHTITLIPPPTPYSSHLTSPSLITPHPHSSQLTTHHPHTVTAPLTVSTTLHTFKHTECVCVAQVLYHIC